jgi:hypothetical protein
MSEYNVNISHDECCGESLQDDDNEDLLDDLNNIDDSEVIISFFFFEIKIDRF